MTKLPRSLKIINHEFNKKNVAHITLSGNGGGICEDNEKNSIDEGQIKSGKVLVFPNVDSCITLTARYENELAGVHCSMAGEVDAYGKNERGIKNCGVVMNELKKRSRTLGKIRSLSVVGSIGEGWAISNEGIVYDRFNPEIGINTGSGIQDLRANDTSKVLLAKYFGIRQQDVDMNYMVGNLYAEMGSSDKIKYGKCETGFKFHNA